MSKYIFFSVTFLCFNFFAQQYKLLPDSCTFCNYKWSFDGSPNLGDRSYKIDPTMTLNFGGNNYISVQDASLLGVRQVGNKVYGFFNEFTEEKLVMDFDVNINDTIRSLYSDGAFYDAIVVNKDSIQVKPNIYHRWIELRGDTIYDDFLDYYAGDWSIYWHEKGLCSGYGGFIYNLPVNNFSISPQYVQPRNCTSDTLVPYYALSNSSLNCELCILKGLSLIELKNDDNLEIVKIIDVLGRETRESDKVLLIYVFSNGERKKILKLYE